MLKIRLLLFLLLLSSCYCCYWWWSWLTEQCWHCCVFLVDASNSALSYLAISLLGRMPEAAQGNIRRCTCRECVKFLGHDVVPPLRCAASAHGRSICSTNSTPRSHPQLMCFYFSDDIRCWPTAQRLPSQTAWYPWTDRSIHRLTSHKQSIQPHVLRS